MQCTMFLAQLTWYIDTMYHVFKTTTPNNESTQAKRRKLLRPPTIITVNSMKFVNAITITYIVRSTGARAQVRQHRRPNRGTDDAESDDAVHGLSPLSPLSRCCPRPSPLCPLSRAPPQNHLISRSSSSFPAVAAPLSETTPNHMLGLVRPRIRAILVGDVGYSLSSRPVMAQSLVAPRSS